MQDSENSEFLNIIVEWSQAIKEQLNAIQRQENSTRSGKISLLLQWYAMPGCLSLMLISILIRISFGKSNWNGWIFVISLLLLCIFYYTFSIFDLWNRRVKIKSFFTSPFHQSFKTTIEASLSLSSIYLTKLMELSGQSLEIGLLELRNQYYNLNQSSCLLLGAIKTIGLVPSIIALLVIIHNMDPNQPWAVLGSCVNVILVIRATIAHHHSLHWTHAITLTELALKKKQELKQGFERVSSILDSCK
jgi:hypothetical protein